MAPFSSPFAAGISALNTQMRYSVSLPTSTWTQQQRAEFHRILAGAYGVGLRQAYLWTSQAGITRPFIKASLSDKELIGRVILAQCLYYVQTINSNWSSAWVPVEGTFFPDYGTPLRTLVEEPYGLGDLFHWNYSGYGWNEGATSGTDDEPVFYLEWNYGVVHIPDWLPDPLRPDPANTSNPFPDR